MSNRQAFHTVLSVNHMTLYIQPIPLISKLFSCYILNFDHLIKQDNAFQFNSKLSNKTLLRCSKPHYSYECIKLMHALVKKQQNWRNSDVMLYHTVCSWIIIRAKLKNPGGTDGQNSKKRD